MFRPENKQRIIRNIKTQFNNEIYDFLNRPSKRLLANGTLQNISTFVSGFVHLQVPYEMLPTAERPVAYRASIRFLDMILFDMLIKKINRRKSFFALVTLVEEHSPM